METDRTRKSRSQSIADALLAQLSEDDNMDDNEDSIIMGFTPQQEQKVEQVPQTPPLSPTLDDLVPEMTPRTADFVAQAAIALTSSR